MNEQIKAMTPLQQGQLVVVTSGEYSDYRVMAVGRATADIDVNAVLKEFLDAHPGKRWEEWAFLGELFRRGLIEEVAYRELHLGGHSEPQVSADPGESGVDFAATWLAEIEKRS